jgi:hypothetical protein
MKKNKPFYRSVLYFSLLTFSIRDIEKMRGPWVVAAAAVGHLENQSHQIQSSVVVVAVAGYPVSQILQKKLQEHSQMLQTQKTTRLSLLRLLQNSMEHLQKTKKTQTQTAK